MADCSTLDAAGGPPDATGQRPALPGFRRRAHSQCLRLHRRRGLREMLRAVLMTVFRHAKIQVRRDEFGPPADFAAMQRLSLRGSCRAFKAPPAFRHILSMTRVV